MRVNEHILYEPDDGSPPLVTLGVAVQGVILMVSNTIMVSTVYALAFDADESYLPWAVFTALLIAGAVTALQASKLGRLGAGYILMMGPGVPLLAACVLAVNEGGLAVMSSLVVASSLVMFAVAAWLVQLRRIITPVVAGVSFMMIAASAMPIAVTRLNDVPAGASPVSGPAVGAATLAAAALSDTARFRTFAVLCDADRDPGGLCCRRAVWTVRLYAVDRGPVVCSPGLLCVAGPEY